jgi:hypothetical protein
MKIFLSAFFLAKYCQLVKTLQYTNLKLVVFPNNVKQIYLHFTQNIKINLNLTFVDQFFFKFQNRILISKTIFKYSWFSTINFNLFDSLPTFLIIHFLSYRYPCQFR